MSYEPETVPCKFCEKPTPMTGTKMCEPCWQARQAIRYTDPAIIRWMIALRCSGEL